MKQIYIFNVTSIGANYGIGTYIKQIIELMESTGLQFNVVHLKSQKEKVTVTYKNGIRYIDIPSSMYYTHYNQEKVNCRYYRNVAYLLKAFINETDQNIFHINYVNQYSLGYELKRLYTCCVVLTVHYLEWIFKLYGDKQEMLKLLDIPVGELNKEQRFLVDSFRSEQALFSLCDRVIAIANHSAEKLNTLYGVSQSKISIINNALSSGPLIDDEEQLQLREKYCFNPEDKLILFVGRTEKVKGFDYLIDAFKIVLKTHPDVRLIIAGGSDNREVLKKLNPFWSRVCFTGFLDKTTLTDFYNLADVGVIPSLYEEFGYVAIEMMKHQLPVIANRSSGLAEIVEQGVTGYLIRLQGTEWATSVSRLALRINRLLGDKKLAGYLGVNGRTVFLRKYESSILKKKMMDFYLSCNY